MSDSFACSFNKQPIMFMQFVLSYLSLAICTAITLYESTFYKQPISCIYSLQRGKGAYKALSLHIGGYMLFKRYFWNNWIINAGGSKSAKTKGGVLLALFLL